MPWISVILPILAFMLIIVVMRARRRSIRPKQCDTRNFDFSMEELHRLHMSGKITAEEFERARQSVLLRRPAEPDDPSKRGFEVIPSRKPMIQSLEDRIAP